MKLKTLRLLVLAPVLMMFGPAGLIVAQDTSKNPPRTSDNPPRTSDTPTSVANTDKDTKTSKSTKTSKDATSKDEKTTSTTADQNKADREMTAKIRKAIVDDKSLSTKAHNVTIKTKNGMVTLTGKVDSDAERESVVSKAKEAAGSSSVTDNLTVTAPKTSKKTTTTGA
jgi:hyperosmotically inducible protein